jgi:hypothetical protein
MIFQYYNLRAKYDKVKAELKKIKEPAAAVSKKAD